MHRRVELFEGAEQAFQSVRQRNGRGRIGQHERSRQQHGDARDHEGRIFDAVPRDLEDPELNERLARSVKQVQKSCQDDDEDQRLHAPEQNLDLDLRDPDDRRQKHEHQRIRRSVARHKQRRNVDDHQHELCARHIETDRH